MNQPGVYQRENASHATYGFQLSAAVLEQAVVSNLPTYSTTTPAECPVASILTHRNRLPPRWSKYAHDCRTNMTRYSIIAIEHWTVFHQNPAPEYPTAGTGVGFKPCLLSCRFLLGSTQPITLRTTCRQVSWDPDLNTRGLNSFTTQSPAPQPPSKQNSRNQSQHENAS